MSSPSTGILKSTGVNHATTLGVDDTTNKDNINNNRRALSVSPSVQFSENVANENATSSHCDDRVGGIAGAIRARLIKVRAPLKSCRAITLKIIHCRLMLMAICALVVIECACVMSELMVDLHGIKLRFDNEAEEIKKFVAHFKTKYPDAFESVEIRRMKDFIHLLNTSTTLTPLDVALCQGCLSDSSKILAGPYTADNVITSTMQPFSPIFKTTNKADQTLHPSNFNSISSSENDLNNVDQVEYYRSKTGKPKLNNDKLTLFRMKQRDTKHDVSSNNNDNEPVTRISGNKEHNVKSTTYTPNTTRRILDSVNSTATNNSLSNSTHNAQLLSIKGNSSATDVSRKKQILNNGNEEVFPNYPTTNFNVDTTDSNRMITTSSNLLSEGSTGSGYRDRITQPTSNHRDMKNSEIPLNEPKPSTLTPSTKSADNIHPVKTDENPNIMDKNLSTSYAKLLMPNNNTKHTSFSKQTDRNNMASSQQNNQNRSVREKRNSPYNRPESSSSIRSTENLFILAINYMKENFYLVGELLPNHVKTNGSLQSRYMDEYKNIYKTSKALHYTSLTILGIMVIETALKLICTGCGFFKEKLEVFDALIVVLSFSLDVLFLDSQWYETGKDATALLFLLLPWRVVRIVNSFVMTIKHKHQIQMMNLKRGKKKAELKTAKVETLLKEIRKDVQLLVNLCKSANVDEDSINACLYGKGRSGGVTQTLMETCASLVLISTLGKNPRSNEDDIYGTLIQEVLDPESTSHKSPEKQKEEQAAIDAAIALDDKIEARRKSSRRKPSLSVRIQSALLKRSHTLPRRCASMEIPDAENGPDMEGAENNVFYIHEETGDIVPEGDYVIVDGDGRYYIRDIILPDEDGGNYDGTPRSRNNTSSEL